jgi:hypothetical protein
MTELEQALVALGREVEIPPTPDLVPAVRRRIERRRRSRRGVALAFAVLVVGIGIAMAVPPARSAILRFFHIGAVSVERVDTLPPAREAPLTAGLGTPRTRAEAEQLAGFRMILPKFEGAPPSRYYAIRGSLIATTISVESKPVLLTELRGDQVGLAKKFTSGTTKVEPVTVHSRFGLFISGGKHVIMYELPSGTEVGQLYPRLAGNVLLWTGAGRTFRLEGELSKATALRIARELTP